MPMLQRDIVFLRDKTKHHLGFHLEMGTEVNIVSKLSSSFFQICLDSHLKVEQSDTSKCLSLYKIKGTK